MKKHFQPLNFYLFILTCLLFSPSVTLSQKPEKSKDAIPLFANKNKKHELGVYSLYKYGKVNGKAWKGDVIPDYVDDPAGAFWETMTAGISSKYAHYTSKCRVNEQVKHQTVFPTDGWKDWDQFDMVFFYGHNNMITPPHSHEETGTFWTNHDLDWLETSGKWADWGTEALPFEYFNYDVTDGPDFPGSVTYLYEPFTAVLLGYQFKAGETSTYQLSAQNTPAGNTPKTTKKFASGLGTNDLEWLFLHGCQAVIVANKDGSEYNPMGVKAFAKTWDGFHIIQGHYRTYNTSQLKELVSFANDLLSGVSIQTAYFETDPANNTSAISAECKPHNYIGGIEKYLSDDSYMNNDTWTNPMGDISNPAFGNFFYYVKWIANDNTINDSTINWYYPIDVKLPVRAKHYILDPGKFPTPELEKITPEMAKNILKSNIRKFCNIQVSDREIDEVANIYCVTAGSKTGWVDKSSGAFSISETKGAMSKPSQIGDFKDAVKLALNYIKEYDLITLGRNETIDLIFASNVMNAAVKAEEEKPFLSYPSDYIVGFGRRYNGIPVIGSYLNLQIGEDGKLLGVQKNWRTIKGRSGKKMNVDSTSIIELTKMNLLQQKIIETEDDFKNIEILSTVCGYFEGSISNTQQKMGLGCLVNYRHSNSENIAQLTFPIADFSFSLLGERTPLKAVRSTARPVVIEDEDDKIEDEDLK